MTYISTVKSRLRVQDMLPRAERISVIETTTATEAAVRELRIIGQEKPPSNRHGLTPEKALWLRLEPGASWLRAARQARDESDGSAQIGPLDSRPDVDPLRGLLTEIGRASCREGM